MSNKMKCIHFEDEQFYDFLSKCMRAEYDENPRVYTKAIRATLIALGYNDEYVNGEFRDKMESFYESVGKLF